MPLDSSKELKHTTGPNIDCMNLVIYFSIYIYIYPLTTQALGPTLGPMISPELPVHPTQKRTRFSYFLIQFWYPIVKLKFLIIYLISVHATKERKTSYLLVCITYESVHDIIHRGRSQSARRKESNYYLLRNRTCRPFEPS